MTIPEEIEQLKTQLAQTIDEQAVAELLVELIGKYGSIKRVDSEPYIDRLLQLAEKMASIRFKALGLNYLANIKRLTGAFDVSQNLARQALALFEQLKDNKGVANALNTVGLVFSDMGDYPEAMKNLLQSLQIRDEIGDRGGMASSYNSIGTVYKLQSNYPEALKYHLLALQILEELNDRNRIASIYNNMGLIHSEQGNYPESMKNYLRALKIKEETGDIQGAGNSYNNIATIYMHQDNNPEALKYFFLALQNFEKINDQIGIATSYNNIGLIHNHQDNDPEALKNYLRALRIWEKAGDKRGVASTIANVANIHKEMGNYPEALKNLLQGIEICKAIGDKRGTAHYYNIIGEVLEKQGDNKGALKNKLFAVQIGEEIGNKNFIKTGSLSLSNTYKATGDFENALKYHEKYHQVESEMLGEQAQKQLTNLSFAHNLEQKEKDLEIEHLRNVELKKERDRSESLLLNILPSEVAEELKQKGSADAKLFDEVTVLFTDFVGFTKVSERLTPQELVDELHVCFSAFDEIMSKHGIEKIKTVGDAYLAACGLPLANANHAENVLSAATSIKDFMLARKKELGERTFEIRIGVHSGRVVAGIVGIKKFAYDIWGDTVNTAARMEQNSEAGKINISEVTYELVKDKFNCEYRGEIEAKNKGKLKMYFLN